jgi:hypothetical protein
LQLFAAAMKHASFPQVAFVEGAIVKFFVLFAETFCAGGKSPQQPARKRKRIAAASRYAIRIPMIFCFVMTLT